MMPQLLLHLIGDYITQSDWMAQNKTKAWWPAISHASIYSVPFLLIGSRWAVVVIFLTHLFIDRFRLARYVVFAKNFLAPFQHLPKWQECSATGYPSVTPAWMAVWLMIIADNTIHIAINYTAIRWIK